MQTFVANQDLTIDVLSVGHAREPVLVIDNFLQDPEALVSAARQAGDWHDLPPGGYPGRRAALPASYVRAVLRRMDGPIRQKLLHQPAQMGRFDCSFSMVTRPPSDLAALQRVPHIDVAKDNRVAILHYLCGAAFGGTAFFRQTDTGLEQVGPLTRARYLAARTAGLTRLRPEDRYPGAQTPGYERTGVIEARFNRLIAYRSFTLHSGVVDAADSLSADPAQGRLTCNFFVDYDPVESPSGAG